MRLPDGAVCLHAEGAQQRSHFDRGIPRYVVEQARALQLLAPASLHSVLLNPALPLTGNLDWLLGTGLLGWAASDRRVAGPPSPLPLVYHVMCPFSGATTLDQVWPRWARDAGVATVVTLYDLIPLIFADRYLHDPRQSAEYEARLGLIRSADQVLAISEATAHDAVEHLGVDTDRVHVIHAGASDHFADMYGSADAAWQALQPRLPAIRPGFMLYVGGFEFRKNLGGLIDGYARLAPELRARHQLVIACRLSPGQTAMLEDRAVRAGLRPGELVLSGYVSDTELGALYHACLLFVFASLYEGSGLPVLEAMSCGAPVAASNTSSLPELLGDLEATFDPHDPASIAACLTATITAPGTLERLRVRSRERCRGYTWTRVAECSIEAYKRAIERVGRRNVRRVRRARIALVTPWPPSRSGVADYNVRLARELADLADVDIVVGRTDEPLPAPAFDVRIVGAAEFRRADEVRQYDRVVYSMGNSEFHAHVLHLLRERPGVVVLHDVRLTGFYGWSAGHERPEDPDGWLAEQIGATYGSRLGSELADGRPPEWAAQHALGLYMTGEVQALAEAVFVHSRFARDVLALDRDMLGRRAPVGVLPFGMPPAHTPAAGRREMRKDAPVIVSLGVVHALKGIAELISGFAVFADRRPAARLVIAGPATAVQREQWTAYAAERAPEADIRITGHLSATRYAAVIEAADIAVQLRLMSNGEASATVADCLSAGLPTLVSDLGWARELPDGVVSRLPVGATPVDLARHLERLTSDDALRASLSSAGLDHARANDFAAVAKAYLAALELA